MYGSDVKEKTISAPFHEGLIKSWRNSSGAFTFAMILRSKSVPAP
jgi:hypothetical protein